MMNNINILLKKLQNFKKVYNKLSKAVPNINSAEVTADNEFRQILDLLKNPNVNDPLNNLIFMAHTTYSSENPILDKSKFSEERVVMQKAGISKRDIEYVYSIYQDVTQGKSKFSREQSLLENFEKSPKTSKNTPEVYKEDGVTQGTSKFFLDVSSLIQIVINLYNSIKEQLIKSRTLNRKIKKKEKKKLYQVIKSFIFGLVSIIVNINSPQLFEFSYDLGVLILYQAYSQNRN